MARRATSGDELGTVDEQAAFEQITGDDPKPGAKPRRTRSSSPRTGNRSRIAARGPDGRMKTKAAMVAEVHAQLYTVAVLGQTLWATRDEACASSATAERLDTITEAATSLIARHPKALEFAASSGIIGDVFKLLSAAVPIIATVVRAHGPGGHGHQLEEPADVVDSRYPAFTPAG